MTVVLTMLTMVTLAALAWIREERTVNRQHLAGDDPAGDDPQGLGEVFPELAGERRRCRHRGRRADLADRVCAHEFACGECHLHREIMRSQLAGAGRAIPEARHGAFHHRGHTWARIEQDGLVRVGFDRCLTWLAGAGTELELPEPGAFIDQNEPAFAVVLADGRRLPVLAPVSGEVLAVVDARDAQLRSDPPGRWIAVVRPLGLARELRPLLWGEEADRWLGEESRWLDEALGLERRFAADGGELEPLGAMALPWRRLVREFLLSG